MKVRFILTAVSSVVILASVASVAGLLYFSAVVNATVAYLGGAQ